MYLILSALDPTKLKARQFSRSAANTAPGARDNSLWTETPAERQARLKDEVDGKRKRATEAPADEDDELKQDDRKRRKYEAEVKAKVEEYNVCCSCQLHCACISVADAGI